MNHQEIEKEAIREKYNRFAHKYNLVQSYLELVVRRLRRQLLRHAAGNILEIAVGTGKNLRFYPEHSNITAIDLSQGMLAIAKKKAKKTSHNIAFKIMDAENLAFRDNSFDTVVTTLSLCTFLDPIAALKEMVRVCKPDGKIMLLENGRSNLGMIARFQDIRAEEHAKLLNSYWNRNPLELAKKAGLQDIDYRHVFFGIFHIIHARP